MISLLPHSPVKTSTRATASTIMFACLLAGITSCRTEPTTLDPTHCNYNEGDSYCAQKYPDGSLPFCESGRPGCISPQETFGCTAERPVDECYSPCGGVSTIDEDGSCVVEGSSSGSGTEGETEDTGSESGSGSGSGSSTTGAMPCMGNGDCMDAGAPFCELISGECVGCDGVEDGDAACAELDGGAPVCDGGECVECTAGVSDACEGVTPVCDEETSTCVGCREHGECGDAACNFFSGACLPAGEVVRVGPGQEFGTLTEAVASFEAEGEGTIIVHQPMTNYDEAVIVDGGRTLAFLANADDVPLWILAGGGAPQLTVVDGTVLMDGIQMSGNGSTMDPGLLVDGGRAWVDRGRIVDNNGGGVVAQNAGELVLRNCFVGGSVNNEASLTVNGATAIVLYSTIAAGFGIATALTCDGAATVTVRNSLLVAEADSGEIHCTTGTFEYNATEADLGDTNQGLGDMNVAWFEGYGSGDLHLSVMAPITIATTAQWQDGDPVTDIDGDARNAVNGTSDVAGADVP